MAGNVAWPTVEKVVKLPKITNNASPAKVSKDGEQNNTQPLKGKRKFSQAAFKVIQQIYNKDKIAEVDEDADADIEIIELPQNNEHTAQKNKTIEKSKWKSVGSLSDLSKRSDSLAGNYKPKMHTPIPTRKKPTIVSVMRMASLNKNINGKPRKPKGGRETPSITKEPEKEEEKADEADLPKTPRFCTSLSREAQFAMLKCYEDLILDSIGNDSRNVDECPPYLLRVTSPIQPLEALHVEERPVSRKAKTKNVLKDAPSKNSFNLPLHDATENKTDEQNAAKTNTPAEERNVLISADNTQLRLSYRFQTAMDMLDNIKLNQGRNITTPRDRMSKVKQLDNDKVYTKYNAWSQNWSKDFRYEFCK